MMKSQVYNLRIHTVQSILPDLASLFKDIIDIGFLQVQACQESEQPACG